MVVQALYSGTNFGTPQFTSVGDLKNSDLEQMMKSENHKNYQNAVSENVRQLPNDIHQSFTDTIIRAALFHREIDKPTTAGTNLGAWKESVKVALEKLTNANKDIFEASDYPNMKQISDKLKVVNIKIENEIDYLLYSFGYMAMMFATEIPNEEKLLLDKVIPKLQYGNSDVSIEKIVPQIIKNRIEFVLNESDLTKLNTYLLGMVKDNQNNKNALENTFNTELEKRIAAAKKLSEGKNKKVFAGGMRGGAQNDTTEIITLQRQLYITVEEGMLKGCYDVIKYIFSVIKDNNFDMTKLIMNINSEKQTYKILLIESIIKHLNENLQLLITARPDMGYTTLSTELSKNMFKSIYNNWAKLSSDAKIFYKSHLMFMVNRSTPKFFKRQTIPNDTWIELTESEVDAMFTNLTDADQGALRINLKKNLNSPEKDILFCASLPLLPVGTRVWFTEIDKSAGASVKKLTMLQITSENYLRELYNKYYTMDSAIKYTEYPTDPFAFDFVKLLPAFLAAANARDTASKKGPVRSSSTSEPCDDLSDETWLAIDPVYDDIWRWNSDTKQYETNVDGKWVPYTTKGPDDNCYGSYLAGKGNEDGKKCERIIECLATGDHEKLATCIPVLKESDMWNVADDDFKNVSPDIIKIVFKKFKIKGRYIPDESGKRYFEPMSHDEWCTKILPTLSQPVQDAINQTNPLMNYIKALINIARANVGIFNERSISSRTSDTGRSKYLSSIGLRPYISPTDSSVYRTLASNLEATAFYNGGSPSNAMTENLFSGNISNAVFVDPFTTPFMFGGQKNMGALRGGGRPSAKSGDITIPESQSSIAHVQLYETLMAGLHEVGMTMNPSENERILKTIRKIGELENKLGTLFQHIKSLIDLARIFGLANISYDAKDRSILNIKNVRTIDDMKSFIRGMTASLKKNISKNLSLQQIMNYDLNHTIFPTWARLIADCNDGVNGNGANGNGANGNDSSKKEDEFVSFSEIP